jgi:MFS family permease
MSLTESEFTHTPSPVPLTDSYEPLHTGNSSPPPGGGGLAPVLKNARFLVLWGGQVFSQLADKFYLILMIALIVSYYQQVDQSISRWVSAIMIANTIPAVLFGSLAGVYVDRWPKKAVLVVSNFLRSVLVLSLPLGLHILEGKDGWFSLPLGFYLLLLVTFLVSALTQFFAPAEQSVIPLIVTKSNLLSANSLCTTTVMGSLIIGFAIGEPLLNWVNALVSNWKIFTHDGGKVLVVGGAYLISTLILLFLDLGEKQPNSAEQPPHVLEDIQEGLRYLNGKDRIRNAMIQQVILFSIMAALSVLAVTIAEGLPELKAEQFGFLLAAGGLGMALGALVLGSWGQRFPYSKLSFWGSLGMGLALLGLTFSLGSLLWSLLSTALLGFFASLVGIPMQTTIQQDTPAEMRGKVFGLQNNVNNIALSLPLALAGILESHFGLTPVLLGLALLALLGSGLAWFTPANTSS